MRLSLGLILLAACSPVVAHVPDATSIDGTPDAPSHGMVTVKVYDTNNPGVTVIGVPVTFVEADGTLVGHPVTDTNGVATADVHANASVTVAIVSGTNTNIETLLGVQPGDSIVLGPSMPSSMMVGTFSVTFPLYSGATSYDVFGPCGSSSGNGMGAVVLTMYSTCKLDPMDITVVPRDTNGNGLAYLTKSGVPFVTNGSTAVTGAYANLAAFSATFTNLDPVITTAAVDRYMPDNYGFYKSASGTPVNGTLSLMAPGPIGTKAIVTSTFDRVNSAQMINSSQEVLQGIAGNVQTYGVDGGMTLLPWVLMPSLDVTNHKIVATTDTTGTTNDTPDVAFAQTSYTRTIGTTTNNYSWLIVGPSVTDFTLPQVPMEVGDVMPKSTDTVGFTLAAIIEADTVNGYNDFRLDIFKNINAVTDPPHPMTAMKVRESLASASR